MGPLLLYIATVLSALGPIQPPIQWEPEALSPGVKRRVREADQSPHSSPSSAKVKNAWSYTSTPSTRLNSLILNQRRQDFIA
jgi:hypothetical protein